MGPLFLVTCSGKKLQTNTNAPLNKQGQMLIDAISTEPPNIVLEANMQVRTDDKIFDTTVNRLFEPCVCYRILQLLAADQVQT